MKKYEVVYGNGAWEDSVIVLSTSAKDACAEVEQELRTGVTVIRISEI